MMCATEFVTKTKETEHSRRHFSYLVFTYTQMFQKQNYSKINNHINKIALQEEVILKDLNHISKKSGKWFLATWVLSYKTGLQK